MFVLQLCSVCVCALVWSAGGVRLGGGARPLALGALSSVLVHTVLLLLRLTRLHKLMPLDWPALVSTAARGAAAAPHSSQPPDWSVPLISTL